MSFPAYLAGVILALLRLMWSWVVGGVLWGSRGFCLFLFNFSSHWLRARWIFGGTSWVFSISWIFPCWCSSCSRTRRRRGWWSTWWVTFWFDFESWSYLIGWWRNQETTGFIATACMRYRLLSWIIQICLCRFLMTRILNSHLLIVFGAILNS